jgi:hypothetical protein
LTDTKICLNCSFEFKETQCPLCGRDFEKSDEPNKKDLKITLVFENNNDKNFEEILTIAKKANFFSQQQMEFGTQYYASFLPEQANDLFDLYSKIEENHRLKILINGKIRPYARTLWLPLLWFLMNDRYPEPRGV